MNTTEDAGQLASPLTEELGPLPQPAFGCLAVDGDSGCWREAERGEAAFDAEQMRAYAAQERAAERERCAKLCDDISDEYQRTEGRRYPELKSDAQEGASKCADAIRA